MPNNKKHIDIGLDCLRTGRVKSAGPFLDSYKHYLGRAFNPWYDKVGPKEDGLDAALRWGARGGAAAAATAGALLAAPHVAGAVGAKGTAATLANTLNASRSAAPLVNAASHIPGAVRVGKVLQPAGKAIVKPLANAAKYTGQATVKPTPTTLTGKLVGGGKAISKTMLQTGMLGGTGKALQGLDDPNNTNSVAQNFVEGFAPSTLRGIPAHIGNKLVPGVGYMLGYTAPEIASAIVNPSNTELQSKINHVNLQMEQGALPFEAGLRQLVNLGAITQEDAEAYIREQGNTAQSTAPDLNLPQQLQGNPSAELLKYNYFNTPQPVQFDLSNPQLKKNIKTIYNWGKNQIPEQFHPLFQQSIEAIDAGKDNIAFNLAPVELNSLNTELVQFINAPEFKKQRPWVQETILDINEQLTQANQQAQAGFENIDPDAPESQIENILPNLILQGEEAKQVAATLAPITELINQMQTQGATEDEIRAAVAQQFPNSDDALLRATMHDLAISKYEALQAGEDTTPILNEINNLAQGGTLNAAIPEVMEAVKDGYQAATGNSLSGPGVWSDMFSWFMDLEGIEQVSILAGLSLGLAGLVTALFGGDMLMSLIMMVLGAGAVAYGVPESRDKITELLGGLMPSEEEKE